MINDDFHVVHPRAAGLDVHKHSITASLRICHPQQAQAQLETKRFATLPSGLALLIEWLLSHRITAACMEATGIYWITVYDELCAASFEVHVYNAQHVKQLKGRKTDLEDSRWLAQICQFGLGRPSLILSKKFRCLRMLSRHRRQLVKNRAQFRNRVHKLLDSGGLCIGGILSDIFGMNGRRILDGLCRGRSSSQVLSSLSHHVRRKHELLADALSRSLNDEQRLMLNSLLQLHDQLNQQIAVADDEIERRLHQHEDSIELLQTIPGINHSSACAILIEIGDDLSVFPNIKHFAAWVGLSPGNHESAGQRRQTRIRRSNRTLTEILVESAQGAARTKNCQFYGYHKMLCIRRGYKRAIVACAHKLARCIYATLRDRQPYRDPHTDYEQLVVQRNAPRWLRQLQKFDLLKFRPDGSAVVDFDAF